MNFRSINELSRDLFRWSDHLPRDLTLVVGIPRSGMLAASLLALHRSLPFQDLDSFVAGAPLKGGLRLEQNPDKLHPGGRRILVLDDSVNSGTEMKKVKAELERKRLTDQVIFGAVYATSKGIPHVDVYADCVESPRVFDWNIFHHQLTRDFMFDLDGVLCRDPKQNENDDGENYVRFLENVPPRVRPIQGVKGIVSARLEKYRPQTESWLQANGIKYGTLSLLDLPSAEKRRRLGAHAAFKASVYQQSDATLFVESNLDQAWEIAQLTNRFVYCSDVRQMISPSALGKVMWQLRFSPFSRWKGVKRRAGRLANALGFRGPRA